MIAPLALLLSLAALAISAGLLILARRASRARRELAERLHDQALALDQRCDVLQRQLDAQAMQQSIDHLWRLVGSCERSGQLEGDAARRLERYTLELGEEARLAAEAG